MNEREIIRAALDYYGSENQVVVAIEELSELQKELCKLLRGKQDTEHIAEEIADVQIMLAQMQEMLGIKNMVRRYRFFKLLRLETRMNRKQDGAKQHGV